ncbi:GIY-YIG nuclease family protein [Leucobacter insecticola]|uniref:GIY-YIG nuclease family protein n=1 Tax=Leucobacter insecticola TaxID=2714934 RepID=A0A6G8FJD5_9MICO|nr:GIY-YIG nuclease family protein [Leucobacter insecticola]QIM16570.1 GIY-YIG nuclease family protein [Leucobacter insecticola]
MPHTYILRCVDGSFYVGSTRNLKLRLSQHSSGHGAEYTKRRLPVELVWNHESDRIDEASQLEKRIQGWSHNKRKILIEEGPAALKGWSARTRKE